MYVIVGPYVAQFNEELKDEINKKAFIRQELMSDRVNELEQEKLGEKLE